MIICAQMPDIAANTVTIMILRDHSFSSSTPFSTDKRFFHNRSAFTLENSLDKARPRPILRVLIIKASSSRSPLSFEIFPTPVQCLVYCLPLILDAQQFSFTLGSDSIVLSPSSTFCLPPRRRNHLLFLKTMQYPIKHALCPFNIPCRQPLYPLNKLITICLFNPEY